MLAREGVEGEQVLSGVLEQPGDLRRRALKPVDDLGEALACASSPVSALEDLADRGGDHRLGLRGRSARACL